ncbi:YciI family protein [Roseateles sp.]|uniref:YciI family protein n=1 Tax=Roseateles sp. TaxID=1971397 RepID=UPI0025FF5C92|nr:YciI family protein [Roseateles sp.]MBV8036743.1 transcription initiation protein [Roseateles sp.]
MPQYLISFNDGAMSHIPEADFPAVGKAAAAAVLEAIDAGVFIFGGGLLEPPTTTIVATDGTITRGPDPSCQDFIGGFTIVEVASRDEAHHWAAKVAAACRCAQDVREFMPLPPEVQARIRQD